LQRRLLATRLPVSWIPVEEMLCLRKPDITPAMSISAKFLRRLHTVAAVPHDDSRARLSHIDLLVEQTCRAPKDRGALQVTLPDFQSSAMEVRGSVWTRVD
jgi:hypothetical protein